MVTSKVTRTIGLGAVMLLLLVLFNADAGGLAIGGLALVAVASVLVKTGIVGPSST